MNPSFAYGLPTPQSLVSPESLGSLSEMSQEKNSRGPDRSYWVLNLGEDFFVPTLTRTQDPYPLPPFPSDPGRVPGGPSEHWTTRGSEGHRFDR